MPQLVIEPLRAALKEQNDTSLRTAAQEDLADREVTIMGDKGTPFAVLKRVMATATAADYGKVSLAVIQREVEVGGRRMSVGLAPYFRRFELPWSLGEESERSSRSCCASC